MPEYGHGCGGDGSEVWKEPRLGARAFASFFKQIVQELVVDHRGTPFVLGAPNRAAVAVAAARRNVEVNIAVALVRDVGAATVHGTLLRPEHAAAAAAGRRSGHMCTRLLPRCTGSAVSDEAATSS